MINKFLKSSLLIILMTLVWANHAYAKNDYVFDPHDPNHSLYVPNGQGPFPVILLLHASTGVVKINHDWAVHLKNRGYIVFIIDSFKPRGWIDRESVGWEKATEAQLADVAPAYQYIESLSFVDPNRIGLLGFSMGGFDVLRVMEESQSNHRDFNKISFKAAASFYGVCHRLHSKTELIGPTSIFIGDNDDRATTDDCKELVNRSAKNQKDVSIVIYKDALHGFDNPEFPPSKEVIDEKGEHYHIGFNEQARQQALHDLPVFFDQYLK